MAKRWILTLEGYDYQPLIYADSPEKATRIFSNETILSVEPYTNTDYLSSIDLIKSRMESVVAQPIPKNRTREWYKVNLESGMLRVKLYKDNSDGLYYDIAEYQFKSNDTLVYPITFVYSNPVDVENLFFRNPLKCEVPIYRFYGQPKMKRPTELKGVKQSFSADYIPNKCKCQCFIKDNDLWIKHRDFFSSSFEPSDPKDICLPLEVLYEKYFGENKKMKRFLYPDCWGDIVLRNEAWIVFRNFEYVFEIDKQPPIRTMIKSFLKSDFAIQYHMNGLSEDWERFFETVCREYEKYRSNYGINKKL